MTEKDKMLAGEIYDANYDEELIAERARVKDLCYAYNHLKPSHIDERKKDIPSNSVAVGNPCKVNKNINE